MSEPLVTQLDRDYLDALALLRPEVGSVKHLIWPSIRLTTFQPDSLRPEARYLIAFDWVRDSGENSLSIGVRASFPNLARVERVEALLYAACLAHEWIHNAQKHDQYVPMQYFHDFCLRAGCLSQNEPIVRERWRKLHSIRHWSTLPVVLAFEDRPKCKICNGPVASGHERVNCHDECLRYAHLILLPAVRVAQAEKLAREANAASEVDK